jgi:phage terminase large subunit-like protein
MRWQREAVDTALEIDPDSDCGQLFYRIVVVTVMRQQGKTTALLPVWYHRCVKWRDQRVAWTMQNASEAREKWRLEHVPMIENSPLRDLVLPGSEGIRLANGTEHVNFKNGSYQVLMAATQSSGHGKVLDLGVVDEAMAQPDDRLYQAMKPAMKTRNMAPHPGSQIWIVSTMGPPEAEWFHGWVDAGRQAVEDGTCDRNRICYVEYSAPEDADPGDPETWWSCMPALGVTIDEDTIREEYEQALLTPDGLAMFRRSSLNQRTASKGDPVIPLVVWDACSDPQAPRPSSRLVFAVDVAPDQASAAIAVCGRRRDGVPQVEVVDHRPGVGWVEERAAELRRRHGGKWRVDRHGPAAALRLRWADEVSGPDAVAACVNLEKAAREGLFKHRDLDGRLRIALDGATKAQVGDAWRWSRKNSEADISPLVAAGLALDGVMSKGRVDVMAAVY